MLRGLLREVGLAAASLILSVFAMTFVLLVLANVGVADAEWQVVSQVLPAYILPFTVGLGAIVAILQNRWTSLRPMRTSLILNLIIGVLFCLLLGTRVEVPLWVLLFFLLPGFLLWGALSGLFARKRLAMGGNR